MYAASFVCHTEEQENSLEAFFRMYNTERPHALVMKKQYCSSQLFWGIQRENELHVKRNRRKKYLIVGNRQCLISFLREYISVSVHSTLVFCKPLDVEW